MTKHRNLPKLLALLDNEKECCLHVQNQRISESALVTRRLTNSIGPRNCQSIPKNKTERRTELCPITRIWLLHHCLFLQFICDSQQIPESGFGAMFAIFVGRARSTTLVYDNKNNTHCNLMTHND